MKVRVSGESEGESEDEGESEGASGESVLTDKLLV